MICLNIKAAGEWFPTDHLDLQDRSPEINLVSNLLKADSCNGPPKFKDTFYTDCAKKL